jgi:hypothetical protein
MTTTTRTRTFDQRGQRGLTGSSPPPPRNSPNCGGEKYSCQKQANQFRLQRKVWGEVMDEFLTHSECVEAWHRDVLSLIPVATWDVRNECLRGG